ncbi:hypothetical protein ACI797_23115 [Geodermatophilus sp. SYSU D00691]
MHTHRARAMRLAAVPALISCLALAACGGDVAAAEPAPTPPPTAPAPTTPEAAVDWKAVAFDAAECYTREMWLAELGETATWDDWPVTTTGGDVTGDGTPETVVQTSCPTPTSTTASFVVVFDSSSGEPDVLGFLDGELVFQGPTVTVDDATVVLEGPTQAGDDPQCCAGHWGRAEYRWDGDRFVLGRRWEARTSQPVDHAGLPDGSYAGVISGGDGSTVLVNVVEWFEGEAAAQQACREDGVAVHEQQAWCNDYYYRDVNDLVRALEVAEDAQITYIDWGSGSERTAPLAEVVGGLFGESYFRIFEFTVTDGIVTAFPQEHFVS